MAITKESKMAIRKEINELERRKKVTRVRRRRLQVELKEVNDIISSIDADIAKLQGDLA